jgi:hypothetical protein
MLHVRLGMLGLRLLALRRKIQAYDPYRCQQPPRHMLFFCKYNKHDGIERFYRQLMNQS